MTAGTFGHYDVVELLGSGGMGAVYRARDTRLDREVAIKVLRPDARSWTAEARERLLREARAISSLNHPHICAVHDIGERGGETFIVMELVSGTPLGDRVPLHGLDPETAVRWGAQLADALEHAHQRGVIHRDIKPSNVVVMPSGQVKLVDFGVAARAPAAPSDTTVLATAAEHAVAAAGTPLYMAPEVIRGAAADARSDIWSLGVLLHETLSGTRPFEGPSREDVTTAILRDAPTPLPSHVPSEIGAIVRKCLAKDPAARYQRAGEIRAALEAVQPRASAGVRWPVAPAAMLAGVLALGALAAVFLLAWNGRSAWFTAHSSPSNDATPDVRGLAVLPLRNLGGDDGQDFFADGMTSALITELAKVESLKVISHTTAMRYRDRADRALPQIGAELGVDAVVEGSVLRAGDRVRISVELVHAGSDRHLWAESYERPLRDVLALQGDIARAVVAQIQSRVIQPAERVLPHRTVNPDAYESYLRGELSIAQGNPTGVDRAVAYYERAIEIDPSFAPAYSGLAGARFAQEFWGTAPFQSNVGAVRAHVARALALDPNLADAHVMRARLLLNYDWDWAGTEAALKEAIRLSPGHSFAYETYCWLLLGQGRRDEALAAARTAASLDPRSAYMVFTEARVLQRARHLAEAEASYKRALELDPGFPAALGQLAVFYAMEGRLAEAREVLDRRDRLPSARPAPWARAVLEAASGNERVARGLAGRLSANNQARVYAVLDDADAAFAALERAIETRSFNVAQWSDREYDKLRPDPRFARLVARMGLDPRPIVEWGRWPAGQ
ncbi:MAG TPA: protein kinase [Vicinamibacterales bacterium]|nr:protein kinase [Vicinamibacterales bacterium]